MASVAQPFLAVLLGFTFNPLPSLCLLFLPAMRVDELSFDLPPELIAQRPLDRRDASRLLLLNRFTGAFEDSSFSQLPQLLRGDELLVFNNARVLPARLFGHRLDTRSQKKSHEDTPQLLSRPLQGHVEVFLTRQLEPHLWEALVKPGRKLPVGEHIRFGAG